MFVNILSLKILALNILKNSFSKKIAEDVNVPELDPCSSCNQELFLYEIKNLITILICEHIYHHNCIEKFIKKCSICPRSDCKKEIESTVDATSESQNTNDLIDISLTLYTDLHFPSLSQYKYSSLPEKRISEFTNKSFSKKVKKQISKEDSPILKKLIEKLTSMIPENSGKAIEVNKDTNNFLYHYSKITQTESKSKIANRKVIESYFNFGEAMKRYFDHYKNLKHGD
ncbi:5321_t:CDS:1 [Ambispora gerdemannii]|uniref:5321_t:CDS:1 n=1 Tax=Ambispora gerdemannii TaxID=144530 RepID=A0A9N9DJT9_9GLOM|nr:5321_t:CDS:1 [Ambispora gerdemannii]